MIRTTDRGSEEASALRQETRVVIGDLALDAVTTLFVVPFDYEGRLIAAERESGQ